LHLHGSALLRFIGRRRVAFGAVGFLGARGVVGSSACLLFLQQVFLLLRRHFGSDLMLGRRLDHAGGSHFTLGSRGLLLQNRPRERRIFWKRVLHGAEYEWLRVLRIRYGTLEEDASSIVVRVDHFQVLLGALAVAYVAVHLLVLEEPARILAMIGGTMSTVP